MDKDKDLQKLTECVADVMTHYVKLGAEIYKHATAYYGQALIKFIKNEPLADGETSGGIWFSELKPLYDKYGYKAVNDSLVMVYEMTNKEDKDNE